MKKIAIIGAHGFIGSALCRQAKENFSATKVTRQNYDKCKLEKYDVVINAAMPSKRYWAFKNPLLDVEETIVKTSKIFYDWKYDKFVQISSISAESQLEIPYGAHKRSAEVIVEKDKSSLIVRLGALYGEGLSKSALFDMINGNHMYIDINSAYNYLDVDFAAKWILNNLDNSGIKNLGARDTITLLEIANHLSLKPIFEGRHEMIKFEENEKNMPSAFEVLNYASKLIKDIR